MTPFHRKGSIASRLQSPYEGIVYFQLLSPHMLAVLIWSTSKEWKTKSTSELPSGFEPKIPGMGIQHPKQKSI